MQYLKPEVMPRAPVPLLNHWEVSGELSPTIVFEAVFKPLYPKMCVCPGGGGSCLLIPLPPGLGEYV